MKSKRFLILAPLLAVALQAAAQRNIVKRPTKATPQASTPAKRASTPTTPAQQCAEGLRCMGKRRYNEAVKWFRLAAERGNARAMDELGQCYQYGLGVEQNHQTKEMWYRRSAEAGYAGGQHDLGLIYEDLHEYATAAEWYRKAANQGLMFSQHRLGLCLEHLNSPAEAAMWYRKAAVKGYAPAQSALGMCYENGTGVAQDHAEASKWYRKAAKNGDAWARKKVEEEGF